MLKLLSIALTISLLIDATCGCCHNSPTGNRSPLSSPKCRKGSKDVKKKINDSGLSNDMEKEYVLVWDGAYELCLI